MCFRCVIADFPIAEKIYEANETPAECRDNFKVCVDCGCSELKTLAYIVSHSSSVGGSKNGDHNEVIIINNHFVQKRNISFKHVCENCSHVVAEHTCTFRSEGLSREVDMTCMLCGTYEDVFSMTAEEIRPEIMTR